jgi:SAM-dependent methyltransferase
MKHSALEVYVCPACHHRLRFDATVSDGNEISEGALRCTMCECHYPIVRGVPRFVPAGDYAESFGRQWNWFRQVQLDSHNGDDRSERALGASTGWADADYRGRRLLDAGVGAGRFAERAAAKGAEVFGVDLTSAVDAAYRNVGGLRNVHLAQADILALPFRRHTFDLAYSIGVLHHTPNPPLAFDRVAETVATGGKLAIYVYARYGSAHRVADVLRVVTTRLPLGVMWTLAAAAIPLYYAYKVPVVGKALRLVMPTSIEPDWRWRWLDTFDWYTPAYQWKFLYPEVFRWFRVNGFDVETLLDGPIRVSGVKTLRLDMTDGRSARAHDHDLVAS